MKRLLSIVCFCAILLAFSGCNNDTASTDSALSSSSAAETTSSEATDQASSQDSSENQQDASYEGELISITFDKEDPTVGSMSMQNESGENDYVFHFDTDETIFGMAPEDLKPGDQLNIRHSLATTSSIPPQSTAFEVQYALAESDSDSSDSAQERLYVADASLFRGVIEDFAVNDQGQTVLVMRRAVGTGYEPQLKVTLTDETKYSFDSSSMGNGAFLEIFYGAENENADGSVNAIAVNDLISEDLSNYNGTLVSITPDPEKAGCGSMLLDPIGDGMQYEFNYDASTQFYMDVDSLKAGDRLNVYHSAISTRSLPPQSFAYEVSAYVEPQQTEQPVASLTSETEM